MGLLIVATIILATGVGLMFVTVKRRNHDTGRAEARRPPWATASAAAAGLLAVLLAVLSCVTAVQAKYVGVGSVFGHVDGRTYNPGLNWKTPWTDVVQIDATVQTDEYFDDSAIVVRTGDGMETRIYLANRWQINPAAATTIYQDYRSNDPTEQFRNAVVDNNLKQAVQSVMGEYNPIAQLQAANSGDGMAGLSFTPDVIDLGQRIQDRLSQSIARDPDGEPLAAIIAVTVSGVAWSAETQTKINDFNTEVANTRVATQREQTAKAEAAANQALADSVSDDPNVLVSKCLDIVQDAIDNGHQLPAGYSCWPGTGAAVVVPGAR